MALFVREEERLLVFRCHDSSPVGRAGEIKMREVQVAASAAVYLYPVKSRGRMIGRRSRLCSKVAVSETITGIVRGDGTLVNLSVPETPSSHGCMYLCRFYTSKIPALLRRTLSALSSCKLSPFNLYVGAYRPLSFFLPFFRYRW